jgi:hypothetical protein
MKWKLLAAMVLMVMAGGVGVALLAQDEFSEPGLTDRKPAFEEPAPNQPAERNHDVFESEAFSPDGAASVKHRFLKLASNYAEAGEEAELRQMADDLQKKIAARDARKKALEAERDSRKKILEVERALNLVVTQYPDTEAAKQARLMLNAGGFEKK